MSSFSLFHMLILAPVAGVPVIAAGALAPALAFMGLNAAVLARIAH